MIYRDMFFHFREFGLSERFLDLLLFCLLLFSLIIPSIIKLQMN